MFVDKYSATILFLSSQALLEFWFFYEKVELCNERKKKFLVLFVVFGLLSGDQSVDKEGGLIVKEAMTQVGLLILDGAERRSPGCRESHI